MAHVFGLIPVLLFLTGVFHAIIFYRRLAWPSIAAGLCFLFYLAKNFPSSAHHFPLADILHRFVGTLPLSEQMWWTGYSYPILLLFFSFYAGRGIDAVIEHKTSIRKGGIYFEQLVTLAVIALTVMLFVVFCFSVLEISPFLFIAKNKSAQLTVAIFAAFVLCISFRRYFWNLRYGRYALAGLLLLMVLLEMLVFTPRDRITLASVQAKTDLTGRTAQVEQLLRLRGLNKYDYRFADYGSQDDTFGFLIPGGMATFKNGAEAIYTQRQQLFRKHILGADWNGFFPIREKPPGNGWARSSAGLFLINEEPAHYFLKEELPPFPSTTNNLKGYSEAVVKIAKHRGASAHLIDRQTIVFMQKNRSAMARLEVLLHRHSRNFLGRLGLTESRQITLPSLPVNESNIYASKVADLARRHGISGSKIEKHRNWLLRKVNLIHQKLSSQLLENSNQFLQRLIPTNDYISYRKNPNLLTTRVLELPIVIEKHSVDRVSCSPLGLHPDGAYDKEFALDLKHITGGQQENITHIDLSRSNPDGVNRTSNKDFILGVSTGLRSKLLNNTDGTISIPIRANNQRLYLFACDDGVESTGSIYSVQLTLTTPLDKSGIEKIGSIGVPLNLFEAGDEIGYVRAVIKFAQDNGGSDRLIEQHRKELTTRIKGNLSKDQVYKITTNFLVKVDSDTLHESIPRGLYLDTKSLPRAYIPESCTIVSGIPQSLQYTQDIRSNIGNVVIETSSTTTSKVCQNHQATMKRVQISSDRGSSLILEEIQGPTILVLNDNFYPGWQAVDQKSGQSIEINPANLAFRAMTLPDNRSYRVVLNYRPYWLNFSKIALFSALFVLVLLLGYQVLYICRKKKEHQSSL